MMLSKPFGRHNRASVFDVKGTQLAPRWWLGLPLA